MESLALSEVERVDDISYHDVVTVETGSSDHRACGTFGGSPNALPTQSKCLYRKPLMMDRYRFKDAK